MKFLYVRLMLPLIPLFTLFILLFTTISDKANVPPPEPYVRLATLWDAPGVIDEISPDGHLIIIYDETVDKSRLVEVATGSVLMERAGENSLRISPTGRFVTAYNPDMSTIQIIDVDDSSPIAEIPGGYVYFSRDDSLAMTNSSGETEGSHITTVIETTTGNIVGEFDGLGDAFSPNNMLITIIDIENMITRVFEISTGSLVAEIPAANYVAGTMTSLSTFFAPDGETLAIDQMHDNTAYIYDVDTWQLRFTATGFVRYNADGRLLRASATDTYGPVQLLDVATGQILDQVFGSMYFSRDGQFLFRVESTNYDLLRVQGIDLSTGQIIFEQNGYISASLKENNHILQVFDNATRTTRFIDLSTGTVFEMRGYATLYTFGQNYLLIDESFRGAPIQHLTGFESGGPYITDGNIQFAANSEYAFASNGLMVDVYGPPTARLDTMPPPRPDGGIGRVRAGEFHIHPTVDAPNSILETSLNPFYFYVLGQNIEHDWVYVVYYPVSTYALPRTREEGWLPVENLEVIEPWNDAPVLDPADPLDSLHEIAEANAS